MRCLLVSRQHHPSHGGIGTYVQRFCRAAKASHWHVELVTQPCAAGGEARQPVVDRIHEVRTLDMEPEFAHHVQGLRRLHRVRPYRYALWSKAVAERLLMIPGEFDAIEFVDCQAEGLAALGCGAIRRRFRGAAFIVHAHTPMFVEETINGADASIFGRSTHYEWERMAFGLADAVITTSNVLADVIAECCDQPPPVIPYPIDADQPVSQVSRERRIVLVGSVQPRKGVDVWARSLNHVMRERPNVTAMLIGPDTSTGRGGGSMLAHVEQLLDHDLRCRFRWAGSLPHEQTREIIATSALVVAPSRLESFSFAAAEALLAGTPVIVSDRAGIAEHVPSLPVAPVGDVEAWAAAQHHALADVDMAMEVAAQCRAEMLESCAPWRVMSIRESVIRARESQQERPQCQFTGDTLLDMASFIADVDDQEHDSARQQAWRVAS